MPNDEDVGVVIETSTDSVEAVKTALGEGVEIEESPAGEAESGVEPEQEQATQQPVAEGEEGEGTAGEAATEEAHPKKKATAAPTMVPRARLNQEIKKNKELERKLASLGDEPGPEEEGVPEEQSVAKGAPPQFFSGKPEPTLEEFTKDVDPYDSKAMAEATAKFSKAYSAWSREEARSEAAYRVELQRIEEERMARTADFRRREDEFAETNLDYRQVVAAAEDVIVSPFMEDFIYESEVGPAILMYFAENPKEAKRFTAMRSRSQSDAMHKLEKQFTEDPDDDTGEGGGHSEQAKVVPPRKPPAKAISRAPVPPSRLKPSGPGPKTERELAGPEDRSGVDIEYNPEIEKIIRR